MNVVRTHVQLHQMLGNSPYATSCSTTQKVINIITFGTLPKITIKTPLKVAFYTKKYQPTNPNLF